MSQLWVKDDESSKFISDIIAEVRQNTPFLIEVSARLEGRRSVSVKITFKKDSNLIIDLMSVGYEIEMIVRHVAKKNGVVRMSEAVHSRSNLTLRIDDDEIELGFFFSEEDTPRVGDENYQGLP